MNQGNFRDVGLPLGSRFTVRTRKFERQEQEQLKKMLDEGIVRPSSSPWASPLVMVKKKDGTLRFCIDFRKLNDVTIKVAHPLPRIDDTLEALKGAKYFSTLDLKSGDWQVPIKEEHRSKTAFRTSSGQLYKFNRLPFGLCNAPATFSRLMDNVLSGLSWEVCLYYLDDIIVFSKGWRKHRERLRMVFLRLREANLRLGPHKCTLAKKSVTFLGYHVSEDGSQVIRKHQQDIHPQYCNSGEIILGPSRLLLKVHSGFFQNCLTIKSVVREEPTVSVDGGVHPSFPGIKSSPIKRTHSIISQFYGSVSAIHRRF